MITLYGMASPNVVKVLILLEELGLDFDFKRVDVLAGEQFSDAFRAMNPNSKAPVLVDARDPDHTATLFESGAIMMYLAEREGRFWPEDIVARYDVVKWLMFQMATQGPISGQALHFTQVMRKEPYAAERFTRDLDRIIGVIDERLEQSSFLAGPDYSLADMAVCPWIRTLKSMVPTIMAARPAIDRWFDGVAARPAVGSALAMTDRLSAAFSEEMKNSTPDMRDRYFGRAPRSAK